MTAGPERGRAAVAAANPLAAEAACAMLRAGGSAVDAAIAAQAALTVVEPNASGIGGGAMLLVHQAGAVCAFDGISAAPAEVPERLETDFNGRTVPSDRALFGGRTVGVPGALRALEAAHRRFGRLPWRDLFAPAIAMAAEGFALAPYVVRTLFEIPTMRDEAMANRLYCGGADAPLPPGTLIRNPDLAATLIAIADCGADAFYLGDIAARIVAAVRGDVFDGRMTMADLAAYRALERTAPAFALGNWRVATAPLPAYGGIAAGQLIGIAARLGITGIGAVPSEQEIHLLAESGRVAFADREHHADPDHPGDGRAADVATMLSPDYLARRARHVDPVRRNDRIPAGHIDGLGGSMTSHVSIADGMGQVVSMTTTINQNFGARIAVGGFYLNNALTNFALQPISHGRRVANAMAPGKRPRTSIAPCIVMDAEGNPIAAVGAGGGFRIIGYVANALLRLAGGMRDPASILAAPHSMNWSGSTEIEPALGHHAQALAARGHFVVTRRFDGGTQMVLRDGESWLAAGDKRRDGVGLVLPADR